jgi:hypothetical protein
VKPLFSKSRTKSDSIPLRENDKIITDDLEVSNIFNTFFQKIGSDIGNPENNNRLLHEILNDNSEHDSLKAIKGEIKGNTNQRKFIFRFVSEKEVIKVLKGLSSKKASGFDEIPAQFIKKLGSKLTKPLT